MVSRTYAPNSVGAQKRFTQNRERNVARAEHNQYAQRMEYAKGMELIEARARGEPTPKFITGSLHHGQKR